jgi:hypothetical protein
MCATRHEINMITELRVYHTKERLRADFNRFAKWALSSHDKADIKPDLEIVVPSVIRIVFRLDKLVNVAGYQPSHIFIDELVDSEIADYVMSHQKTTNKV